MNLFLSRGLLVCLIASFTVCLSPALAKPAHKAPARKSGPRTVTGTAVYYSDKMQGRGLAMKGEKYDSAALTAATHSGFPLGSTVKVTNLSNHKSVTVKVNDRMNPRSKSVIDLSRKAAEEIDLIHAGHARVRVEAQ